MNTQHANELLRCLLELDIDGMRRLHKHLWPHFPQPKNDEDALYSMHLARLELKRIHPDAKRYSEKWLLERRGPIAKAVGVAVMSKSSSSTETRRKNVESAMLYSLNCSINAGLDIDADAKEVRRRMLIAREKERGGPSLIGWQFSQPKVSFADGKKGHL